MAVNLFSTSNLLLASSFLLSLTSATPIPRALDVEKDNIMVRTPRDMWSEVAALHPRYSTIDNIRIDDSAILPRSPVEASNVKRSPTQWVEARFDPNERKKLSRRFSTTESSGSPPEGSKLNPNGGMEASGNQKREEPTETPAELPKSGYPAIILPRVRAGISAADVNTNNAALEPQGSQRRSPTPSSTYDELKKGTGHQKRNSASKSKRSVLPDDTTATVTN